MNKLTLNYKDEIIKTFNKEDRIADLLDFIDSLDNDVKSEVKIVTERCNTKIRENFVEDVPGKEWTIWSATDLVADSNEQIPLVKIILNDDGELEAKALSDDNFDQESFRTATNSLKASTGKDTKARLLRVDKSLNHNDPFFSTELQRQLLKANKNVAKKDIKDIIKVDPKNISDEPIEGERDIGKQRFHRHGVSTLAAQILLTNRDDLKAIANRKGATEEDLTEAFKDMTGVDYYTEKIVNQEQYNYVLDLLGRSTDKYNETYVGPEDNKYIQSLKDVTEDLIEKVLLKEDPDFYKMK